MPSDAERALRRLQAIRDNIEAARQFVAGVTRDNFISNREKTYAVVRALEIVSEAARHLPDAIRDRHPEIEWAQIRAAGNFYRHEYEGVALDVIWNTVQADLGPLHAVVLEEIERFES